MREVKSRAELEAIIRAEAQRIGPWPRNMQVVIYTLDDSWRAMFGYSDASQTDFKDKAAALCAELRDRYDLRED